MDYINTIIAAIISSGFTGTVTYWVTFKSMRKKASAEADSAELNNVQVAIKIWRDMAQDLAVKLDELQTKYDSVLTQVDEMRKSIDKLNTSNARILTLLNKMKPENFQRIISEIEKELKNARE